MLVGIERRFPNPRLGGYWRPVPNAAFRSTSTAADAKVNPLRTGCSGTVMSISMWMRAPSSRAAPVSGLTEIIR